MRKKGGVDPPVRRAMDPSSGWQWVHRALWDREMRAAGLSFTRYGQVKRKEFIRVFPRDSACALPLSML